MHFPAAQLSSCTWHSLTRTNMPYRTASSGLLSQRWNIGFSSQQQGIAFPGVIDGFSYTVPCTYSHPKSRFQIYGVVPNPMYALKLSAGSASTHLASYLAWQGAMTFKQTAVQMSAGPDPPSRPYTAESATSSRPVTRGDDNSVGSRPMTPTQRMQQEMAATQRKRLQRLQVSKLQ